MPKFTCNCNISVGAKPLSGDGIPEGATTPEKFYEAGDVIELSASEAEPLLDSGAIEATSKAEVASKASRSKRGSASDSSEEE